jgi:hypothetical protein
MNVRVMAIVFDHARGLAPGSTVPLRYDAWQPVLLPEWQRGQLYPSVAAYVMDRLGSEAVVFARFAATPDVPRQLEVRALAEPLPFTFPPPARLLGDLAARPVSFDASGQSAWLAFAFGTAALSAAGVDAATLQWRWQARVGASAPWVDVDLTMHRIYVVLDLPGEPWQASPPDPSNRRLPRSDMLDLACLWARGARSRTEAAAHITQAVNRLGGSTLFYDAEVGAPHYTVLGGSRFLGDAFLDRLRGGNGAGPLVNCSDCATIVSTFTNLLGGELWQSKMGLVGPGFRLNPILAIGSSEWSTLHGGFGFHEVAWTGDCDAEDLVYDACVSLDADANPAAAPHVPQLPLGMRFGRPGDGGYRDRIALPADRDECAPQPALRIRRAVADVPPPALRLPPLSRRALAMRTHTAEAPSVEEGWRFEGFSWFGVELGPDWLPAARESFDAPRPVQAVAPRADAQRPARTRVIVSTWRTLRQPRALLRIEVLETDSAASAREAMLEAAADIASPGLRRWLPDEDGETGVALDSGALALFTRGNLMLAMRSAGLQAIDVRGLARQVDRWLVGAGGTEPSVGTGGGAMTGPVWLRWLVGGTRAPPHQGRSHLAVVTPRHAVAWAALTRSR